jgi:hypothetical protein
MAGTIPGAHAHFLAHLLMRDISFRIQLLKMRTPIRAYAPGIIEKLLIERLNKHAALSVVLTIQSVRTHDSSARGRAPISVADRCFNVCLFISLQLNRPQQNFHRFSPFNPHGRMRAQRRVFY